MPARPDDDELEIRRYLHIVWSRKWLLIVAVVAFIAASIAYDFLAKPVYRASTDVLLQGTAAEQVLTPTADGQQHSTQFDKGRVETEIAFIQSGTVEKAVEAALGGTATVAVEQSGDSDVVTVSSQSTDADRAATVAQTYAETYIKIRRDQLVKTFQDAAAQVQQQIDQLGKDRDALNQPLTDLDNQIATASTTQRTTLESRRNDLEQEISDQRARIDARTSVASDQRDQFILASSVNQTGGAQIVSDAEAPRKPVSPNPTRNALLALIGGLLVGFALVFIVEHADDRIKRKDDLEKATSGLPTLALIPSVSGWRDSKAPMLATVSLPESPTAEAYRALRTSLQFIALERSATVVLFTSPSVGDGKTTTISNVAVALARAGQRVIVVDCDLRRPRVHRFFGFDNEVGFTSVLLRDVALADAVHRVESEPRLAVLPSGPPPPNPSEMLSSKRALEIIATLREEADFVLIDAPPLLPVTDAIILAGRVDAVVLVASARATTKNDARRGVELLRQIDAPIVGTALNRAESEDAYGYRYGYRYAYNASHPGRHRPRRRLVPRRKRQPTQPAQAAEEPVPSKLD